MNEKGRIYRVLHSKIYSIQYTCLFQADAAAWDSHRSGCCCWSRPAWQPRQLVASPSSFVIPVSAWRLTASATEKMTVGTSRTSPDTAPVSTALAEGWTVVGSHCSGCRMFLQFICTAYYPCCGLFVLRITRFAGCQCCGLLFFRIFRVQVHAFCEMSDFLVRSVGFVDYACPGFRVEDHAFLQFFYVIYGLRVSVTCTIIIRLSEDRSTDYPSTAFTSFGLSVLSTVSFCELSVLLHSYRKFGAVVSERFPSSSSWTFIICNMWFVCSKIISNFLVFTFAFLQSSLPPTRASC